MRKLIVRLLRRISSVAGAVSEVARTASVMLDLDGPDLDRSDVEAVAEEASLDLVGPVGEPEEGEDAPAPPVFRALGGDYYELPQILNDFEGFGLYDISEISQGGNDLDSVRLLIPVTTHDEAMHARTLVREAPDGVHVSLGAVYHGRFILFVP